MLWGHDVKLFDRARPLGIVRIPALSSYPGGRYQNSSPLSTKADRGRLHTLEQPAPVRPHCGVRAFAVVCGTSLPWNANLCPIWSCVMLGRRVRWAAVIPDVRPARCLLCRSPETVKVFDSHGPFRAARSVVAGALARWVRFFDRRDVRVISYPGLPYVMCRPVMWPCVVPAVDGDDR
jgi:hypothetical protein